MTFSIEEKKFNAKTQRRRDAKENKYFYLCFLPQKSLRPCVFALKMILRKSYL